MDIRVITIESSAWNSNNIQHAHILGEFADENEALTEIWRNLVLNRQHRAYLVFRKHPWIRFWHRPVTIVWGGLHRGMPRMYQEPLDSSSEKKASRLAWA